MKSTTLLLGLTFFLVGCGSGQGPPDKPVNQSGDGPIPTRPKQALENGPSWGTIKGRIVWGGREVPQPEFLKYNHPDCNQPILIETWVVNPKNKGIRDTFVWLKPLQGKLPVHPSLEKPPSSKVVIDVKHCRFVPHAVGMREGQTLLIKNSDRFPHNVVYYHPSTGSVAFYPFQEWILRDLESTSFPIAIGCNIHSWMLAYVGIFDHPYFAVTDEDGRFAIRQARAEDWLLRVWHGRGGWLSKAGGEKGKAITIGGDIQDLGELAYPPP